jgi:hypothetical protein
MAQPFEAGVGAVAFDPTVDATRSDAQLAGHLLEGSTRIEFEQGQDPSKQGSIAGPRQFALQPPALSRR